MLTSQQVSKLLRLYFRKKLSERKVAAEVGCSRSTVWYHIQKALPIAHRIIGSKKVHAEKIAKS